MTKSRKKAVSILIVAAMVISLLPLGALTAFAADTASPSSPTSKVITGTASTAVKNQAADNITIKEDSADKASWGTADRTIDVNLPANVAFAAKPTVTFNGTALPSSQVSNNGTRIEFTIAGDNDKQDVIVVSNITLTLNAVSSTYVTVTINGLVTDPLTANIAKVKNGLIFEGPATINVIKTDSTSQSVDAFSFTESTHTIVAKDDFITVTAPTGITFYQPPTAATTNGITLYSNTANLNDARTEAKWQVSDVSTSTAGKITVSSAINVAASFAADSDINFTGATSSTDYTVAPASVKVAKSSAADALTFAASTAPTITNDVNQKAADVTITESKAAAFTASDATVTVELLSGTFASSPVATPSGAGLTLKNAAGDAVTTGLPGSLSSDFKTATWTLSDQSTAAGKLAITGLAINAKGLSDGAVKVKVYGTAVGLTSTTAKQLTIANVSTSSTVQIAASSAPALLVNTANQAAGDITITETKAGALVGPLTLSIFGNTSDKEVLFGQKPTVSVTSGDLGLGTVALGADNSTMTINFTASTEKSVIKITGIKYDINSKAKSGAVQLVITDNGTRLGSVSNGTIGSVTPKFSDVPATHFAFNAVQFLSNAGTISGRTSGAFDPNASITRGEFAKIICLAAGLTPVSGGTASFSDTSGHWAAGYIEAAKTAGLIGGYPDGTFRPNALITRAEIAKMVVGAAGFATNTSGAGFSDIATSWAKDFILTAANNGIVNGYSDGTFRPDNHATRAEASVMVYNWLAN